MNWTVFSDLRNSEDLKKSKGSLTVSKIWEICQETWSPRKLGAQEYVIVKNKINDLGLCEAGGVCLWCNTLEEIYISMDQHIKITEADSSENKIVTSQWCNLSNHLLSQIFADHLGLKELLKIRGVCKDWKSASLEALAHVESSQCEPWFLIYGEGSKCSLLSNEDKLYTLHIPELDGATCLASNGGWLLLFCQGSMFFFCPFTRAKIDLPKCPLSELSDCFDHVAAFSSAPTSLDCMVVVIRRWHEIVLQLYLLYRGDEQWSEHEYLCTIGDLSTIKAATYREGVFQISDGFFGSVTFDASTKKWRRHVEVSSIEKHLKYYKISRLCFWLNNLREKVGLEANVSISACGTLIPQFDGLDILIQNENIQAAQASQSRQLKGVWIQPRFFKIPHDHRW